MPDSSRGRPRRRPATPRAFALGFAFASVWLVGAVLAAALSATAAGQEAKPTPLVDPTAPTLVRLDYQARPVAEIIRTLAERSGGQVEAFSLNDSRWSDQVATLAAPAPLPLWEAVDRLCETAPVQRSVTWAGPLGNRRPRIQFQPTVGPPGAGASNDEGPAVYPGPFRLGPFVVHEESERVFVQTPRANERTRADGSAFYVEVGAAAEPSIVWSPSGPIRVVEAVDDLGQSLVPPAGSVVAPLGDPMGAPPPTAADPARPPSSFRVELAHPPRAGRRLVRLEARAPVTLARRPILPTSTFPLAGAAGKTFRDGRLTVEVREAATEPSGRTIVRLTIRGESAAEPKPEPNDKPEAAGASRRNGRARLWAAYREQVEIVDAQGRNAALTGGAAPGADGSLRLDYTYAPQPGGRALPPTQLRTYRLDWVDWEVPISARDLPLP